MSARFHGQAHYQAATPGYRLLPFRFVRWNDEVLLVNDVGEFLFLKRPTFQAFVTHALAARDDDYENLKAKHFLMEGTSTLPISLLATKYRSKKSFLEGFTKLHLFIVTLRCDHSCPYCQVSRVSTDRARFDMSTTSAMRSVDLVFESPTSTLK